MGRRPSPQNDGSRFERQAKGKTLQRPPKPNSRRAVDPALKASAEASLGANLSEVRVHEGEDAAALAAQHDAKAFTKGRDIYLGEHVGNDRNAVLAHEVAHAVQQSGGTSRPPERRGRSGRIAAALSAGSARAVQGRAAEAQADVAASAVLGGRRATVNPVAGTPVQRKGANESDSGANADEKGSVPESGRKAAGLKNYEATLGKFLGGHLYKEVHDATTDGKIGGYADDLVEAALKGAADQLEGVAGITPEAADAVGKALTAEFGDLGTQWVESTPSGQDFARGVQRWTDNHPAEVAGIVLLAAGAAVAADMKIPKLHTSLGITDQLRADVGARLGTFQDITLEHLEAGLTYRKDNLKIRATAGWNEDKGANASVGISLSW